MTLLQPDTGESAPTGFDAVEWAFRLGVALFFIAIGCEKVFPWRGSYWITLFAQIGLGQWFRVFTGSLQIAGGLLMIVPLTAAIGAAILACTMIGAILAHFFVLHTGLAGAIIPAAFLGLILGAARRRLMAAIGRGES